MKTVVIAGVAGALCRKLTKDLSRKVEVYRRRTMGHPSVIQYYLKIEGSHPSSFGPMKLPEINKRLAMLDDLLNSGVIKKGDLDVDTSNETTDPSRSDAKESDETLLSNATSSS